MWRDEYLRWLNQADLDPVLKTDIIGKTDKELEEMFYTSLAFGTGGMRGMIGAGINRLNIYTIRKANDGLARYLLKTKGEKVKTQGVVIAHDNRHMSKQFALESAKVLGAYGIKSYLFNDLRPTPELSFATRYLKAAAGIVVTASHNPPNYNGYKIYDEYGCQFTPIYADEIVRYVNEVTDLFSIKTADELTLLQNGLLVYIGEEIDNLYIEQLKTIQINHDVEKKIKIVFTPLHGASAEIGLALLSSLGYQVYPVEEQMIHDPGFGTVKSPNPENASAFEYAIKLGKKVDADILIATDPDADRLGVAVKKGNDYVLLTGNQTGAILINYLLSQRKKLNTLPKKGIVFNTIVTSDLGAKIARAYGFEVKQTLTGFKYIGEQIRFLENTDKEFLFGYEESYGYVIKDFVRDKDSLQPLLLASEAAAYYQTHENKTLLDKLNDIYETYGVHLEALHNIDLFGIEGANRIQRIMSRFRNHPLTVVNNTQVSVFEDYQYSYRIESNFKTALDFDKTNAVKYVLDNGSWFVLRPSGTEPKLKIYVGVTGETLASAKAEIDSIGQALLQIVNEVN